MLQTLFALLSQSTALGAPAVSAASVETGTEGACSVFDNEVSQSATLIVVWSLQNPNSVDYEIRVYENNILVAVLDGAETSWEKTISGSVQTDVAGESNAWFSNWTYRVDVVRIADGVAVSSASTPAWTQGYGDCGGAGH